MCDFELDIKYKGTSNYESNDDLSNTQKKAACFLLHYGTLYVREATIHLARDALFSFSVPAGGSTWTKCLQTGSSRKYSIPTSDDVDKLICNSSLVAAIILHL